MTTINFSPPPHNLAKREIKKSIEKDFANISLEMKELDKAGLIYDNKVALIKYHSQWEGLHDVRQYPC
jgi:hypothetical protein